VKVYTSAVVEIKTCVMPLEKFYKKALYELKR